MRSTGLSGMGKSDGSKQGFGPCAGSRASSLGFGLARYLSLDGWHGEPAGLE